MKNEKKRPLEGYLDRQIVKKGQDEKARHNREMERIAKAKVRAAMQAKTLKETEDSEIDAHAAQLKRDIKERQP